MAAIFPDWLEGLSEDEILAAGKDIYLLTPVVETTVQEVVEAYAEVSITDGVVISQTLEVELQVNALVFAPDDIYITQNTGSIPTWLEAIIDDQINGGTLADEVDDLNTQFNTFEDGVTLEIGYLKDADSSLAYSNQVLKVSTDNNTAGIQNLDIVKVTENEAIAISNNTIAAWQSGGAGGAWFDSQVSVVSSVAYSAAKSASTLTASIDSIDSSVTAIIGDIDTLQSQVDGKVETWFSEVNPVDGNGDIIPTVEPYATWVADGTVPQHTGDTYVYFEYDAANPTKKNIITTFRFAYDTDASAYEWYVFKDDLASVAYQAALDAQSTADGKINTFYQTFPPTSISDPTLGEGDLWVDSDDDNKIYRYDGATWVVVEPTRIQASVTRLDEATVDVNGTATAKSSLVVQANGAVSGFVASASSDPLYEGSEFKIFADRFAIAATGGDGITGYEPFLVQNNQVYFNGKVTFSSSVVDDNNLPITILQEDDFDGTRTIVNGGSVQTGTLAADRIIADTVWVGGAIQSIPFVWSNIPENVQGFKLMANPAEHNTTYNIVGGKVYAGELTAARIRVGSYILGDANEVATPTATNMAIMPFTEDGSILSQPAYSGVLFTRSAEGINIPVHGEGGYARLSRGTNRVSVSFTQSFYGRAFSSSFTLVYEFVSYYSNGTVYSAATIHNKSYVIGIDYKLFSFSGGGVFNIAVPMDGYVRIKRYTSAFLGDAHEAFLNVTCSNL